jgi:uncharacterized protein DUF4124
MPIKIATSPGWLILLALLALPAAAQTLYKSTLPDGRIVYGDKPAPGAAKVEESKLDASSKGLGGTTAREAEALKELEKSRGKREAAGGKLQAAEEALRRAEAARDAGKEPLPGERIGTAGGASRLTDAYLQRQKSLEENVENARRSLEQALSNK